MSYVLTPYVIISAIAAIVAFFVAAVAWQRRDAPGGAPLVGLMLAVGIWSAGAAIEYATVSIPTKIMWAKVQYIGVVTCPVFFFLLALEYDHLDHWLNRRRIGLLFVVPIVTFVLALTNEWHGLIWPGVTPSSSPASNLAIYSHGVGFWIGSVGYAYSLMLVGTLLLIRAAFRYPNMYWRQAVLLVAAVLAPWVVNVVYILGLSPDPGLELTPLVLVFTGVVFAWCIFRFRLLDLAPVARETMIETMADGMLVVDERDRVVDYNPAAQRIVQGPIEIALGQVAADIFADWTGCTILINDLNERRIEMSSSHDGVRRYLELHMSPIRDGHGRDNGRLIVLHDITARKAAQTEIELLNSELEQRVAQRTADYLATIQRLEEEIATRRIVEEQLRQLQESLVEQLETQGRKMNTLYETMLHYDNQADADQVLAQALEKIASMMHASAVCMHEVRGNAMHLVAAQGLADEYKTKLQFLEGVWLDSSVPFASFNLQQDRRLPQTILETGYGAYLAAMVRLSDGVSGVLHAFWDQPRLVTVEDIVSFSVIAEQVALMLENARLRKSHEQRAVQGERKRLARDLHDSVTQSLHSLSLLVSALRNRMQQGQPEKVEATLTHLDLVARQVLKEMRLLLYEMRYAPPESVHLVEVIQTRLEAVENRAGIDATIDLLTPESWPHAWDVELLPIVMEALNNSLKHASASRVHVQLAGGQNWLEMTICDNGRGFSASGVSNAGIGLQSMRERTERLGGTFQVESKPGAGALITIGIGTPAITTDRDRPWMMDLSPVAAE